MDLFLTILALAWITLASIQDLKRREVYNWISFSLVIFALAYRAIYSVIHSDFMFLFYGLLGLGIFIILGYAFYYARVFAGGDAKLLMSLGAVLPVSLSLFPNFMILSLFIFILLLTGSFYGLAYTLFLVFRNKNKFSREFLKQAKTNKKIIFTSAALGTAFLIAPFLFGDALFLFFPVIAFLFPVLYVYGKAVEESCLIVSVPSSRLSEGDWLYEKVKFKGKTIQPYWEGLSRKEIDILKKYNKKVKIKQGIPFVPAFFFAFLALIIALNFYHLQ